MFMNLDRRLFSDVKICSPDLAHFFVVNREIEIERERERERERIHEKHYIFNVIWFVPLASAGRCHKS